MEFATLVENEVVTLYEVGDGEPYDHNDPPEPRVAVNLETQGADVHFELGAIRKSDLIKLRDMLDAAVHLLDTELVVGLGQKRARDLRAGDSINMGNHSVAFWELVTAVVELDDLIKIKTLRPDGSPNIYRRYPHEIMRVRTQSS